MRPDTHDFDDEIRGHMALSVRERIERGEDPESARLAAMREFGNVTLTRESMRTVWRPPGVEAGEALWQDIRVALRSLRRAKGLAIATAMTLALGIGANAAIFSVVRQVLLRPLVNRDEGRLVYIRQSAPGLGDENTTFSVPEINDLRSSTTTIGAFGDFSTIDFTMIGFGEPRVVKAGVVGGSYFDVMGLRPVLGRLLDARDDGPTAAGAAVLTYRFWNTSLDSDPTVIGRTVRLGSRHATVVGVLEPSVPYPVDTQIIANVVTSPHHLGATMVTLRSHRMTELFGRLAPGATLQSARAELTAAHTAMMQRHPDSYSTGANVQLSVTPLRDQITAPARPVLILLLAVAAVVFAIACANITNLILARTVRRERELAVRAALGASPWALRRTLLAESLVLCGSGALLGLVVARPFLAIVGRYAARFSVRALDVTVDASVLWVGATLAIVAAIVLAYVPRLPTPDTGATGASGRGRSRRGPGGAQPSGAPRMTADTKRRLHAFAIVQVALSFVLLVGAGALLTSLANLESTRTGYDMRQVLAVDVPMPIESLGPESIAFFQQAMQRIATLPGVQRVAPGNFVPWRDAGTLGAGSRFRVDGNLAPDAEDPHGRLRIVGPGFFSALSIPVLAGRDFTDEDRRDREPVVVVSQSVAQRLFAKGDALNRHVWWTDPYFGKPLPRRIVGIVADVDDEHVVPTPALTIYHPFRQMPFVNRLFVHTTGDPHALVAPVTRIIQELSAEQPVERAATLAEVRAEVLAPERLNAFVFSGFAAVAALIAVIGVAGVLAFSVSARTREFGVRLAIGSAPGRLLTNVLSDGVLIAAAGIVAGVVVGYGLVRVSTIYFATVDLPGALPVCAAAGVLMAAAAAASLMPAARAAHVDVVQVLRSE